MSSSFTFAPLTRHFSFFAPLSRYLPWHKERKIKSKQESSSSSTPLQRVAEARRQGKSTVRKRANPRLERYLANTDFALCRDEEWETMHDVGREIVD